MPAPPLQCPPLGRELLTFTPGRRALGLGGGEDRDTTRFPVQGFVLPPSALMWGGPGPKPFLTGCLPEDFELLPLPCDGQIPRVKETLKEISLLANEETEEQRGYKICPKSHSNLVEDPVCLCYRLWSSGAQLLWTLESPGSFHPPRPTRPQALPIKQNSLGAPPGAW